MWTGKRRRRVVGNTECLGVNIRFLFDEGFHDFRPFVVPVASMGTEMDGGISPRSTRAMGFLASDGSVDELKVRDWNETLGAIIRALGPYHLIDGVKQGIKSLNIDLIWVSEASEIKPPCCIVETTPPRYWPFFGSLSIGNSTISTLPT